MLTHKVLAREVILWFSPINRCVVTDFLSLHQFLPHFTSATHSHDRPWTLISRNWTTLVVFTLDVLKLLSRCICLLFQWESKDFQLGILSIFFFYPNQWTYLDWQPLSLIIFSFGNSLLKNPYWSIIYKSFKVWFCGF